MKAQGKRGLLRVFCAVFLLATWVEIEAAAQSSTDLVLSYSNVPGAVSVGQYFRFTVSVYNSGVETATNVVITNVLPPNAVFVGASATTGTVTKSNQVLTCVIGSMSFFRTESLTIELKAISLGSLTNSATVSSDTPDPVSTNNQVAAVIGVTQARFFGVAPTHTVYLSPLMTLLTNNDVLVVGQHLGKTCDLYNISSRSFTLPSGTMVGVHENGSATLLNNGLVLLAGGGNATGAKTAEVYNSATQGFQQVGDMLVYSYGHYATPQTDGTVLLCGGALSTNELYNPVTQTFSYAPTRQCAFQGIYLSTGKFLYFGYGRAYLYDTNTSSSVETSGFLQPRAYHTATLLPNGKVLLAGGQGTWGATSDVLTSAELYDPLTDTFTWTANLTGKREYHSACLLPDGTVLLAGGMASQNNPYSLTTAEVYDPNGTANVPGIIVSDASVLEGNSGTNYLSFNVSLTTNSALPVTVQYATTDGTAKSYSYGAGTPDYVAVMGTVSFAPGATNQVVQVPVLGDGIMEPDETIYLNLSVPTQGWIVRATATGTILNDDSLPTLTISPVSVIEGDSGLSNAVFNTYLSAPSLTTVTVDYFTSDQTAQAGSDYVQTAGTLTFNPGDTALTIQVPVIGDLAPEPDETFAVRLTNAQNAVIVVSNAVGTILNDDGFAGHLHHFDWTTIPSPQTQTVVFPVTITARDAFGAVATNVPWPVRLSAQTTNVVAANLDFEQPSLAPWTTFDYTGVGHPFQQTVYDVAGLGQSSTAFRTIAGGGTNGITQSIFLAGNVTYTFKVNVAQSMESYDMSCLGAGIYLTVGTNSASWGTDICGGTARQTLTLVYTPPTNGIYPLQLLIVRDYYYGDALAVYLDDVQISYPVIAPTVATNFTNGVWTGSVAVLQGATNVALLANDGAGHKGTCNPFDILSAADLSLSGSAYWIPSIRTGDRLTFNLVVTNRGPSAVADPVVQSVLPTNLTLLSATNSQGSVTNSAGLLQWSVGALAKGSNATVSLVTRTDVPGGITNVFTLSSSRLELNTSDNSLVFTNQIFAPILYFDSASGTEAAAAATGMVLHLSLSGPCGVPVTLDYYTADNVAIAGVDYIATNSTVTFAPFTTNAAIRFYAIDNILDQPDRQFFIWLTNFVNCYPYANPLTGGVIVDDDPPPVVWINNSAVLEGDSGTTNAAFQITLSKPAINDVTVYYNTSDGTATVSNNDYVAISGGSVVFPAGTTNQTILVAVRGNTVNEPDEFFYVNLPQAINATLGTNRAIGTIINDDAVAGRLDHFAFGTVPSPQYNSHSFPITVTAVDYLGSKVSNFAGSATLAAQTDQFYTGRLFDDFEDGDLAGWTTNNAPQLTASNVVDTAANGTHSLKLSGKAPLPAYFYGLRRQITNDRPTGVSFYVKAAQTNAICGRVNAMGGAGYSAVDFYMGSKGLMGLASGAVQPSIPYQSNRWYRVDLVMNWTTRRVDCRIDGSLAITNVPFASDPYSGIDYLVLQNTDTATSWFDDVHVFTLAYTNLPVSPSNLTGFVGGVWSNNVTVAGVATNVYFSLLDNAEHTGRSGFFDLLPVTISLVTPATVTEGDPPTSGQVRIPVSFPQPKTITLTSTVPTELTVPLSVTILANQTNASFNLTPIDDTVLDGAQQVSVIASATNFASATNVVTVLDNELAVLTLTVPATVPENAGTLINQGHVTSSAPPNKPVTVPLISSDTNVVQVPASVIIQSNQTTVSFNVTIVNNQRLDGDHTATISTTVPNWTNDSKTITVTDDETTNLRLSGPAIVNEGSGSSYSVFLTGILTTNVTINLSSSNTNALVVQPSSIVLAGQTSAVFTVTAPDNALFEGAQSTVLSATAPGFTAVSNVITIPDNDTHHLGFSAISSPQTNAVPFAVSITGRDILDGMSPGFNGLVSISAAGPAGPAIVQPASVTLVNGAWSGILTVFTVDTQVTLSATTTNGLAGATPTIQFVAPPILTEPVAGGSLVFSPASQRIWALVGANSTLVPINPFNGFVEAPVPVGPSASRAVTAGDGRYLHLVAINGTVMQRFDTLSRTIDLSWTNGGLSIEDLAAQPSNSAVVAVSWACPGCSPRGRGVFIYDNGIARSNAFGVNTIEFGEDPSRIYGYNNDVYGRWFAQGRVDGSGITQEATVPILGGWSDEFTCSGGLLFARNGLVYDPETAVILGAGNDWWGAPADKAANKFFSIDYFGRVSSLDLTTLLPLQGIALPGITGPSALIRWGTNGLAFSSGNTVTLLRSAMLPTAPPADLKLALSSSNLFIPMGGGGSVNLIVSNAGPNRGSNALLACLLPPNVSIASVTCNVGFFQSQTSNNFVCAITNLPAGGSANVTLQFLGGNPGMGALRASVTTDNVDPNPSNNIQSATIQTVYALGADTVLQLQQPTADIAWNSNLARLVIAAPNVPLGAGNSLLLLDPLTGKFDSPILTGQGPDHLSVHPDGQFVYAALNGENAITRVNLSSRQVDQKFSLPRSVNDLAVKPDDPSVVVAATTPSWPQVLVYRNGVLLPNGIDPSGDYWDRYIEFSSTSPSLLYYAQPGGLLRVQIGTNGATVLNGVGGMIDGFDRDMRCSGGRVFTSGGRVFDPETSTLIGTVPFPGLVAPDSSDARAFYLSGSGAIYTLACVNFTNLQVASTLTISNVIGTPTSLVRWGTDGLAFRTTGGQLFVMRTTAADDRDNDGLADSWELAHFGSLNAPNGNPGDDPDHDGFTNLEEYRAGLDPLAYDPLSITRFQVLAGGAFQLSVLGNMGHSYALLASTNLSEWKAILKFTCTNIPAVISDPGAANFARRYYRVAPVSVIGGPTLRFATAGSGSSLTLALDGVAGCDYRVETSTNLQNWIPLTNFQNTAQSMYFQDAPNTNCKFYRAIME